MGTANGELAAAIVDYIEQFYNPALRHSSLRYLMTNELKDIRAIQIRVLHSSYFDDGDGVAEVSPAVRAQAAAECEDGHSEVSGSPRVAISPCMTRLRTGDHGVNDGPHESASSESGCPEYRYGDHKAGRHWCNQESA